MHQGLEFYIFKLYYFTIKFMLQRLLYFALIVYVYNPVQREGRVPLPNYPEH